MAPPKKKFYQPEMSSLGVQYFVKLCTDLAATRKVEADTGNCIKGNFIHRRKFELLILDAFSILIFQISVIDEQGLSLPNKQLISLTRRRPEFRSESLASC